MVAFIFSDTYYNILAKIGYIGKGPIDLERDFNEKSDSN